MRRALAIARASLRQERAAAPKPHRTRDELAFLPAVLEVTETPASPTARWLAAALCVFMIIALAWAWFGHVDMVATAEGRILPSGRSKLVQPPEAGVVRAIHVRDGQIVRQGQPLIELDPTTSEAEAARLRHERDVAQLAALRLQALLALADGEPEARFEARGSQNPGLVAAQQALLRSEWAELLARRGSIAEELTRRAAEQATVEASVRRLDEVIPLVRARTEARGELARAGVGSRLIYLEAQQQLAEARHERVIQQRRMAELDAAIGALRAQRIALDAEFTRTRRAELAEAERQLASLTQEVLKAEQRQAWQSLTAPIDGQVQQLAVHTVGGVVQAGQQLLVVVPQDDGLEVEAAVLNRDIGFVRPGQAVQIKLETFMFTRYGLVPGEVISVSGDAIQEERRGLVFAARIRLLRSAIQVDGRETPLTPGMNVTVEIRIGDRRVLDYLLSPIVRYRQEALRER